MVPILIQRFCTIGPYTRKHLNKPRRFGSNGRALQFTPRTHELRNSLRSIKIQPLALRHQVCLLRSHSCRPAAGDPASARWHVFRSQVLGFRFQVCRVPTSLPATRYPLQLRSSFPPMSPYGQPGAGDEASPAGTCSAFQLFNILAFQLFPCPSPLKKPCKKSSLVRYG